MVSFIDEHRADHRVGSVCKQLPIAPSTCYEHNLRAADPKRISDRSKRDKRPEIEVQRVWDENEKLYGVRKVWRQLHRENIETARCTVDRLMKRQGIQDVRRGATCWTTESDDAQYRPAEPGYRQFVATRPNQLWVADITYVLTWSGFLYVAFVIDVYARRIVGWRISRSLKTELLPDALEQALWPRTDFEGLFRHSDRGSQYLSIR